MTEAERRTVLDAIAREVAVCTRCRLHENRTRAVPGEGHPDTEVIFVGEGPGFNEDRQGRPFVGRAGDLLERLLASIGWTREEVFIANVVKCRPPENRDPEPDEIAACSPFLTRQLQALDPALVVTLGRYSMARFSPGARIGQVHGTFRPAPTDAGAPNALVYFMYHPAAALRDPGVEATSYRDMAKVPDALIEARARRLAKEPAASLALEPPVPVDKTPAAEPTAGMESSVSLQDRVLAELPDTQAIQPSIESPAAPVAPERTAIPVHPDHPAGPEIGEAILPAIDSVAADAERDPTDQLTLF